MKTAGVLIFIIIEMFLLSSCEKITYYDDNQVIFNPPLLLAHRGGRNDTIRENTLTGCINALHLVNGIEIDVQLSKNRTIWLSHSSRVEGCNETYNCFAETYDSEIEKIKTCNGNDISYTRLEEVMKYMNDNNIRKYISIDMKGWAPCSGNSLNVEAIMRVEVEEIITLAKTYNLEEYILFENVMPSVLLWAKKKSRKIKTFIVSYGDMEKGMLQALQDDFDGISFKTNFADPVTNETMNLLHRKGLMLMAWNINDSINAESLISMGVDFIQIDL